MKINLRKSAAIQNTINDAMREIGVPGTVTVSPFASEPDMIVAMGNDAFMAAMNRRMRLLDALYDIRESVAKENTVSGVNTILTKIAKLDRQIGLLKEIILKGETMEMRTLKGKLQKAATADTDRYSYGNDDVETSVFTAENIEHAKKNIATMRRQKVSYQDDLLALNVTNTIEIDTMTVDTLRHEGIID
jgi:hypothetical protein